MNAEEPRRIIQVNGKKLTIRAVHISPEARKKLGRKKRYEITQLFAVNPRHYQREYAALRGRIIRAYGLMSPEEKAAFEKKGPVDFVADKAGYSRYQIECKTCSDTVGYCYAKDATLKDWCDAHYYTWHDERYWHGAMAINVSPIDDQLGFECACGEDTRDFRANRTLSPTHKRALSEHIMKHRDFNTNNSKFIATPQ